MPDRVILADLLVNHHDRACKFMVSVAHHFLLSVDLNDTNIRVASFMVRLAERERERSRFVFAASESPTRGWVRRLIASGRIDVTPVGRRCRVQIKHR